jgi:hypothetical protein
VDGRSQCNQRGRSRRDWYVNGRDAQVLAPCCCLDPDVGAGLLAEFPLGRVAERLAWLDLATDTADLYGVTVDAGGQHEAHVGIERHTRRAEPLALSAKSLLKRRWLAAHA